MQISIGMALVRGAGALISYLLRDEFITDRAAGAVNGTAAEPGGQTRTVTDGNSKLTIASGLLAFATGGVGGGNPGLWYPSISRVAGTVLLSEITPGNTSSRASAGFDSAATGAIADCVLFGPSSALSVTVGPSSIAVGFYSSGISYPLAVIARDTGHFYFTKQSGAWVLVYLSAVNTGSLFPAIGVLSSTGGVFTSDYIRIPTDLWLPTPLCSDGFASAFGTTDGLGHAEGVAGGIGAGGSGLTWTGATWSVSGAKAVNTPVTLGSEVIVNGDFSADATWTKDAGWTIAGGVGVHSAVGSAEAIYQNKGSNGVWYIYSFDVVSASGGTIYRWWMGGLLGNSISTTGTKIATARATGSNAVGVYANGSFVGTIDNVSLKALTLSELFASVSVSTADVLADVNVVVTAGTQAGLVLNLDSAATPANFVITYHNGTNVLIEKCVAGVYTTVLSAVATYSAGATLRVAKIGSAYRVYYNNALVGSVTIADAGIISNSRHGLFSTYSQNSLDNFVLYASGSEGQYSNLDAY